MPQRVFYCFDEYRLDAQSRVLYRGDELIRLEPKILDMLLFLVERHGLVVSKDELMKNIWPGSIVEETAIRRNISLMRSALDATDMDRFIETLPRQGYRLRVAVHVESADATQGKAGSKGKPVSDERTTASSQPAKLVESLSLSVPLQAKPIAPASVLRKRTLLLWINLFMALLIAGALLFHFWIQPEWNQPEFTSKQLTTNAEGLPIVAAAISPNGNMIAFADETQLFVSDTRTIERHPLPLPGEVVPSFLDWMPDNIHLLVSSINPNTQESALWSVPILGGTPELLLRDVHMASVSMDGERIVFVRNGNQLWLANSNGTNAKLFATAPANKSFSTRPQFSADRHYVVDKLLSADSSGSRIESRNVDTGAVSVLYDSSLPIPDFRLTVNNELLISQQPGRTSNSSQLLATTIHLDSGMHSMMRVVASSPDGLQAIFSTTRDGQVLLTVISRFYSAVYVADLLNDGTAIANARRLTLNDSHSLPMGWIAGSHKVLMFSNRSGHFGIFQQAVDSADARALVTDEHDYVRPVVTADKKWLFYFMTQDVSKQAPGMKTTLMRQSLDGSMAQPVDTKADFYRSLRCATSVDKCVIAEHDDHATIFYAFDAIKGRGAELGRIDWVPQTNAFYWDLSHDGTRIAYIDSDKGPNDIGIMTLTGQPAVIKQLHLNGYDAFATLYWDAMGKGFYVSSYGNGGEVVRLMHIGMDGTVQVLRQQVNTWLSWAVPSDDGKYLALQTFARQSNIWLLQRH